MRSDELLMVSPLPRSREFDARARVLSCGISRTADLVRSQKEPGIETVAELGILWMVGAIGSNFGVVVVSIT